MDDLQMWSLLVGAGTPLLISIAQQPTWSPRLRAVVAVLACLVVGAGTAWFNGELNGRGVTTAVLIVLVAALTTYRNVWKPIGVARPLEAATALPPAHEPATGPTDGPTITGPQNGA